MLSPRVKIKLIKSGEMAGLSFIASFVSQRWMSEVVGRMREGSLVPVRLRRDPLDFLNTAATTIKKSLNGQLGLVMDVCLP